MRLPRPWLMWSEKSPWSTSRFCMTVLVLTACYVVVASPEKITGYVVTMVTGIATTLAGVWGVGKFMSSRPGDKTCATITQATSSSTEEQDS